MRRSIVRGIEGEIRAIFSLRAPFILRLSFSPLFLFHVEPESSRHAFRPPSRFVPTIPFGHHRLASRNIVVVSSKKIDDCHWHHHLDTRLFDRPSLEHFYRTDLSENDVKDTIFQISVSRCESSMDRLGDVVTGVFTTITATATHPLLPRV